MKDYNFTLFHKSIDSISEAIAAIDKAEIRLRGAVYEADYDIKEDDVLHEVYFDLETMKCDLKEMKKKVLSLE